MNLLNRNIAPDIKTVDRLGIKNPEVSLLDNGIPVYLIDDAEQDVIKVELMFKAGRYHEPKSLIASFTNKMLKEGTRSHNSLEIAENIDFYGAHLEATSDKDMAYITLYSLNKHLEATLPIMAEIIREPVFPEPDLNTLKQNRKQQFIINNEKVKYLAKRKFNELIFGPAHPYGKLSIEQDYDDIQRGDLIEFHQQYYVFSNCKIIAAGKIPLGFLALLNHHFGALSNISRQPGLNGKNVAISDVSGQKTHLLKKDAVQAALRIGKTLFNKKHPDYTRMKILNTVLGGYFGSRLMTNIREDKGYTYGIGSGVVSLQNSGYFFITSEVGSKVKEKALKEIYHEINVLQQDLIPEEELTLVKNYMMGSLLRSMDGAFALSDNFKALIEYGLDFTYYDNFIENIKSIKSVELRELAQNYLSLNSLTELVVGSK